MTSVFGGSGQLQEQTQIPFGNDKQKSKADAGPSTAALAMRLREPSLRMTLFGFGEGRHTPGAKAPFSLESERPKAKALGYLDAKAKADFGSTSL
jgi:hypothetical protein